MSRSVTRGGRFPLSALDLAAAFPQLGLDEWQTERRVDVFFASRCEDLAPAHAGPQDQRQAVRESQARAALDMRL